MTLFWIHDYVDRTTVPSETADSSPAARVRYLEERTERLEMVCEAMWNLLKAKFEVKDEDLLAQVAQLDLTDGVTDGKVTREPLRCPNCGRANSRRHDRCIYCATPLRGAREAERG